MLRAPRSEWSDADAFLEAAYENGWTDGLPVVPATPEKVERFLAFANLAPDAVLGDVPTREVIVTAEQAAINAVMAGCLPEYFPVVVAAVRAHLDVYGNSHSTTATMAGAAHAVIVNGPVRGELGIACEGASLGPGFRANATIGRALRLVIRNVCRAIPGFLDRATFSSPLRYSFCFGEHEEAGPWTPLHVQRGLAPEQSAVTVQSVMRMTSTMAQANAPGILDAIVAATRLNFVAHDDFVGDGVNVVFIVGKEHQRILFEEGWSKEQMQEYVWPRLTAPSTGPRDYGADLGHPENVLFVAAGGGGLPETVILLPHLARAITRPVDELPTEVR